MDQKVTTSELPNNALLAKYQNKNNSQAYTDCFRIKIDQPIEFSNFVEAFYTSRLFKIERFILSLIGKPSNDLKARQLALVETENFAAWRVEARQSNQLLLCDFMGKTRSWLMLVPSNDIGSRDIASDKNSENNTTLFFGSAVVFKKDASGQYRQPFTFRILAKFHIWYSKRLLISAYKALL